MKRNFNIKRYFQVLGISFLVIFVVFIGLLFLSGSGIDSRLTPEEIATVSTEGLDGKINILFLGLDESELRTDCMMVASYDTKTKKVRILSIPRDTRMFIGSRYQKINAAHAVRASHGDAIGAQGSVEAVTRLTGIPINYYIELPFDAVEQCIDIMGPVTFDVPDLGGDGVGMVYDDPVQNLHINIKPGLQELNGEQCVHLLRYRRGNFIDGKTRTYKKGDIERIGLQQEFVKALIDQKLNAGLIADIPSLFGEVSKSLKTNLSFKNVVRYAPLLTGFDAGEEDAIKMWTLPGAPGEIDGVSYYLCDLAETRRLVEEEFGFDASKITDGRKAGDNSPAKPLVTAKPATSTAAPTVEIPDRVSEITPMPTSAAKKTEKPESPIKTENPVPVETEEPAEKIPVPTRVPVAEEPQEPAEKVPVEIEVPESEPVTTKTPTKDEE